jgi:quinol monooxygenase YgiN
MFVVTVRFTIPPEKRRDAVIVLTALCSQANALPGCRLCRAYENIGGNDGDDEILLLERWDKKESMEKHILTPNFQQLIEIMDYSTHPPELLFYHVSSTTGIDLVEKLCRHHSSNKGGADYFL